MPDDTLADVKRALAALRTARARILELERGRSEPIAVVGLGCRFPGGADTPEALWSLLAEGRDGLGPVPEQRWNADAWYHPDRSVPGRTVVRRGGFLPAIDRFDPDFFGISKREAAQIDPQQRLLLEVASEALERAGQPMDALRGSRTGVFVGICASDFAQATMFGGHPERIDAHTGSGSAISMAAGRLAYTFGFEGPALTVDTACSSSLVAVHLACQALRAGECDLALAAGVNVLLSPNVSVYFSQLGVLSPSGRVRTFDAGADGYVRSDGCGAVVLRRLSTALAARDPVLAVLRGSAINQNGRGNGLTAPNGRAQESVIRAALESAGRMPAEVGYVEAFGAATPLGDRIEIEALDRVFGRTREAPLWVGSVKTNLGHAEGAAGMASLIKAVLAVRHGQIPPSLNWERPPQGLPWDAMALRVPVAATPWPSATRCAGVSGFGFSGSNVHVVLESHAESAPSELASGPVAIALSGRSEPDVRTRARRLLEAAETTAAPLADVAYTLGARRSALGVRAARVVASASELEGFLAALADGRAAVTAPARTEPVLAVVVDESAREEAAAVLAQLAAWGVAADATIAGSVAGLPRVEHCDIAVGLRPGARAPSGATTRLALADALGQVTAASTAALWTELFTRGVPVRLDVPGARAVALPTSPFARERFWPQDLPATSPAPTRETPSHAAPPTAATAPSAGVLLAPSHEALRDAPEEERLALLQTYLHQLFARLLRTDPERLPVEADLSTLGLDSLVAVDAIGRVLVDLGLQVYPTELFEHASIAGLARHLARHAAGVATAATPEDHRAARASIEAAFPARPPAPLPPAPVAGSTLLRVMLAGHPRLFAPPELHLLLADTLGAWHARLAPELLTLGLAQAWMGLGLSEHEALRKIDDAVARDEPCWAMYAALSARLADSGRVLVDKSPSYGFDPEAMARAEQWFANARYVHLVRHPYAVVESFARLRMGRLVGAGEAPPHVAGEQAWALSAERIGAFLDGVDPRRWLRVRYEDLVADPRASMARLCGFLDLPMDDAVLEPYAGARMVPAREGRASFLGDPGFARHGRIDPALGERWRAAVPAEPLQPATTRAARAFGYALPETPTLEATLPEALRAAGPPRPGPYRAVLLTGATGFLGAWLLADLLERTDATVHVLVRAPSPEAGLARVRGALEGIQRASLLDERRVRVHPGDLAQPSLGLSETAWAALAEQIDAVIHNGAVVHFTLGQRQLFAPNVAGTLEVLRLAATARTKPVLHISTKGVFSPRAWHGDGAIAEDAPLRPLDAQALGYQHTKWAAERLVTDARERGIPTAIVRPGRIGGDVMAGKVPADDLLVRFVRGCIEIGAVPDVEGVVEVVPVDVVSRAVVELLGREATWGRAFHLMHPAPVSLESAARSLRRAGHEVTLLPYADWRARLRERVARGEASALGPVLAMFTATPPDRVDDRRFDAANTRAVLGDLSVPPVGEQLDRTLAWLRAEGLVAGAST